MAVEMFDQGRTTLDPVAVVRIDDVADRPHFGVVDMSTDHAIEAPASCHLGHRLFEIGDVADRILNPVLEIGRQRPISHSHSAAEPVEPVVELEREVVGPVTEMGQPLGVDHHGVELIAVDHQKLAPIGGDVDHFVRDSHLAEIKFEIVAHEFIVIAWNECDRRSFARLAQQFLNDVIVGLRPIPRPPQPPTIDHVTDEIEVLGLGIAQEIEKIFRLAAPCAQMDVGNPDRPVRPDLGLHHNRIPGFHEIWRVNCAFYSVADDSRQ